MTEPTIPYVVPPLDVMKEVTALLNAGMKPSELNQILAVMTKALREGHNHFDIAWSTVVTEQEVKP